MIVPLDVVSTTYQGSYGQEKSIVLRAVRKSQEILLKLEESQEKVRKFYQSNEFCNVQFWSYIDAQRSLVKFRTQACSLQCNYTICNSKM